MPVNHEIKASGVARCHRGQLINLGNLFANPLPVVVYVVDNELFIM